MILPVFGGICGANKMISNINDDALENRGNLFWQLVMLIKSDTGQRDHHSTKNSQP
jgi:hypothetical protein